MRTGWYILFGAVAAWFLFRRYRRRRSADSLERQYANILSKDTYRVRGKFE
jgi:hypothetical protein